MHPSSPRRGILDAIEDGNLSLVGGPGRRIVAVYLVQVTQHIDTDCHEIRVIQPFGDLGRLANRGESRRERFVVTRGGRLPDPCADGVRR